MPSMLATLLIARDAAPSKDQLSEISSAFFLENGGCSDILVYLSLMGGYMRENAGALGNAFLAILCCGLVANRADGFDYISQQRSVSAETFGSPAIVYSQNFSAPDMGDFDATADVLQGAERLQGYATQHQHSTLLPGSISVSGGFDGVAPSFAGTGYAKGRTITDIHFNVAQDTGVCFSAKATYVGLSGFSLKLLGPGMNVEYQTGGLGLHPFPPGSLDLYQTGTLTPGSYEFLIDFQADKHTLAPSSYVTSFDVVLSVPEPALAPFACSLIFLVRRRRHS